MKDDEHFLCLGGAGRYVTLHSSEHLRRSSSIDIV
jgi:hypothetical protein